MPVIGWFRDRGVICYEVDICQHQNFYAWRHQLLESGLEWFWESQRYGDSWMCCQPAPWNLPQKRPLTALTPQNDEIFLDWLEGDKAGGARTVNVYGMGKEVSARSLSREDLQTHLERFVQFEQGPIRLVIFRMRDSPPELIFVPHQPAQEVRGLLRSWGIEPGKADYVRKYRSLNYATLERQLNIYDQAPEKGILRRFAEALPNWLSRRS
jgi:hypothetical protein